jgi:hypothetical protein
MDLAVPRLQGASLVVCQTAAVSFRYIVKTIGGPQEKLLAEQLLQYCRIVPDPFDTTVFQSIITQGASKKLKDRRNAAVFATGLSLGIPTVTTNTSYIRSAENTGLFFNTLILPPRALAERKQEALSATGPSTSSPAEAALTTPT